MNTIREQKSIKSPAAPNVIIGTQKDNIGTGNDKLQEELEGEAPSEDETEVNPDDAKISRSE